MRISEFEYHTISELITMENRELAQRIELDIWRYGPSPDKARLQLYVNAMRESQDAKDFHDAAFKLLNESGLEFLPADSVSPEEEKKMGNRKLDIKTTRTPPPADYYQQLVEGESFEGK